MDDLGVPFTFGDLHICGVEPAQEVTEFERFQKRKAMPSGANESAGTRSNHCDVPKNDHRIWIILIILLIIPIKNPIIFHNFPMIQLSASWNYSLAPSQKGHVDRGDLLCGHPRGIWIAMVQRMSQTPIEGAYSHDGSVCMYAMLMVCHLPSIYPSHVSINLPLTYGSVMGIEGLLLLVLGFLFPSWTMFLVEAASFEQMLRPNWVVHHHPPQVFDCQTRGLSHFRLGCSLNETIQLMGTPIFSGNPNIFPWLSTMFPWFTMTFPWLTTMFPWFIMIFPLTNHYFIVPFWMESPIYSHMFPWLTVINL